MPDTTAHAPPLPEKRARAVTPPLAPELRRTSARAVYFALLQERQDAPGSIDARARWTSRAFLADRLSEAARLPDEIPGDPSALLGEGRIDRNHIVLYRKLLRQNGCEDWDGLPDEGFVQREIQLSLEMHFPGPGLTGRDDFNEDLHLLKQRLCAATDATSLRSILVGLMAPANHHTPIGLIATRIFTDVFERT